MTNSGNKKYKFSYWWGDDSTEESEAGNKSSTEKEVRRGDESNVDRGARDRTYHPVDNSTQPQTRQNTNRDNTHNIKPDTYADKNQHISQKDPNDNTNKNSGGWFGFGGGSNESETPDNTPRQSTDARTMGSGGSKADADRSGYNNAQPNDSGIGESDATVDDGGGWFGFGRDKNESRTSGNTQRQSTDARAMESGGSKASAGRSGHNNAQSDDSGIGGSNASVDNDGGWFGLWGNKNDRGPSDNRQHGTEPGDTTEAGSRNKDATTNLSGQQSTDKQANVVGERSRSRYTRKDRASESISEGSNPDDDGGGGWWFGSNNKHSKSTKDAETDHIDNTDPATPGYANNQTQVNKKTVSVQNAQENTSNDQNTVDSNKEESGEGWGWGWPGSKKDKIERGSDDGRNTAASQVASTVISDPSGDSAQDTKDSEPVKDQHRLYVDSKENRNKTTIDKEYSMHDENHSVKNSEIADTNHTTADVEAIESLQGEKVADSPEKSVDAETDPSRSHTEIKIDTPAPEQSNIKSSDINSQQQDEKARTTRNYLFLILSICIINVLSIALLFICTELIFDASALYYRPPMYVLPIVIIPFICMFFPDKLISAIAAILSLFVVLVLLAIMFIHRTQVIFYVAEFNESKKFIKQLTNAKGMDRNRILYRSSTFRKLKVLDKIEDSHTKAIRIFLFTSTSNAFGKNDFYYDKERAEMIIKYVVSDGETTDGMLIVPAIFSFDWSLDESLTALQRIGSTRYSKFHNNYTIFCGIFQPGSSLDKNLNRPTQEFTADTEL